MTMNCWCVRGPSCHRHGERHGQIGLGKPLARYHDGDDAHEGHLQRFSRRWWRRLSSIGDGSPQIVQSLQSGTCSTGFWGGNLPVTTAGYHFFSEEALDL